MIKQVFNKRQSNKFENAYKHAKINPKEKNPNQKVKPLFQATRACFTIENKSTFVETSAGLNVCFIKISL